MNLYSSRQVLTNAYNGTMKRVLYTCSSITFVHRRCVQLMKSGSKVTVVSFVVIWQNLSNHGLTSSKDSSRHLQTNYAISYLFYLHLMFHACIQRFDVMGGRENILGLHVK
jgi:hypothetical protein